MDNAISVFSGCTSMRVYVPKLLTAGLSRGPTIGSHMYVLIPVNVSYNTSINRWWIVCVGIPHTTWCMHVLRYLSHQSVRVAVRLSDELVSSLTPVTSF